MFLLDTNVVSESRRVASGRANIGVVAWLAGIEPATSFISAMTLYELELGILLLKRRDTRQASVLRQWLGDVVIPGFSGRILALTDEVALRCASLHVPDPASERDSWIAATALVHGLTVVTRNIADFARAQVPFLNPWQITS
jgi:predicted nucleic acid-binding protein